jgi:hypothetical protein
MLEKRICDFELKAEEDEQAYRELHEEFTLVCEKGYLLIIFCKSEILYLDILNTF